MFILRYRKSCDNLSSSDVTLSSRIVMIIDQWHSQEVEVVTNSG